MPKPQYVYHGSQYLLDIVRPQQARGANAQESQKAIYAAETVDDLRIPPSNNLESLSGDRKGQWSIRINHKYRICFTWSDKEANNVEIVEYH